MKKVALFTLLLCLFMSCCSPAVADAKFSATDKLLVTFEGDWAGYFFAKIENKGDSGAYVDYGSGTLVGFDPDDNILFTEEYIHTCPSQIYLEPGDYVYARTYFLETAMETSRVSDYKFSIKSDDRGTHYNTIPCEAEIIYLGHDSYDNEILVTFTNQTNKDIEAFSITAALYDQDGNLIFVNDYSTSLLIIHPNSTVTARINIENDVAKFFGLNSLKPTSVDAIVYVKAE